MIDSYLFLPDNLMTVLYEEQKLIQSLLDFPFKTAFPMFKTVKTFSSLIVHPLVSVDGLIIRPCSESSEPKDFRDAFILGDAKNLAEEVLLKLDELKQTELKMHSKRLLFSTLKSKAWYYAEIDFTEDADRNFYEWQILNKTWVKANKSNNAN